MSQHLLDEVEINGLIAAADDELMMAILLGCCAGLRYREIMGLKWCDIDWERKVLSVRSGRTGRGREIPLHPALESRLSRWRRQSGHKCRANVFSPPSVSIQLKIRLRRLGEQLKVQRIGFNDFRRWFAVVAVRAVDLNSAAALLGHAPRTVQLRYAKARPKRKKRAARRRNG